jgi:hypothetical protein
MELPRILLVHAGHPHHAPDPLIALLVAREQIQQATQIEPIRLRAPRPPIDFNARRIDHAIAHGVCHQPPVQPKPLAARFITAHNRRLGRQLEPDFRAHDFLQHSIGRTRWNLPNARPLPESRGEPGFHERSPSSNASNNVGATEVATAVDSSVRVMVIIVMLLVRRVKPARCNE